MKNPNANTSDVTIFIKPSDMGPTEQRRRRIVEGINRKSAGMRTGRKLVFGEPISRGLNKR